MDTTRDIPRNRARANEYLKQLATDTRFQKLIAESEGSPPRKYTTRKFYNMSQRLDTDYLNCTFEPGDLIDDMIDAWGGTFERLSATEKAWLLYQLSLQVWQEAEGGISDTVTEAIERADYEMSVKERLVVLEALVGQLKEACRHAP